MIIEKNISIPAVSGITGRPVKYPFVGMEVGDSVFFDNEPKGSRSNPAMAAVMSTRRFGSPCLGWKFTSRTEGNGVRIWRVE